MSGGFGRGLQSTYSATNLRGARCRERLLISIGTHDKRLPTFTLVNWPHGTVTVTIGGTYVSRYVTLFYVKVYYSTLR